MSLTFGQAKEIVKNYCGTSGKDTSSPELNLQVIKVLQYLLITGSPGGEKLFEFYTGRGYFTAPYELETPLKMLVNGRVGNVVNKWFEFRSGPNYCNDYIECAKILFEDPNPYYTAFEGPESGGYRVGIKGTVKEDVDAHIIVSGKDQNGYQIYSQHKGARISGEYLSIEEDVIHWSNYVFTSIDGIKKSKTCGYTPLYWKDCNGVVGLLSDYSPYDEAPTYRRFKLNLPECTECSKITILGRTRLKNYYADSDRIPFDNLYNIEIAAQQVQAQGSNQMQPAADKDRFLTELIDREAVHKRMNNGVSIEVYYPTSGGTVKGIMGRLYRGFRGVR